MVLIGSKTEVPVGGEVGSLTKVLWIGEGLNLKRLAGRIKIDKLRGKMDQILY